MRFRLVLALIFLPVSLLAAPQCQDVALPQRDGLDQRMTLTTLSNGLRVAVIEDHRFPVVSYRLLYQVGSVDEKPNEAGFAHLLEHLMFEAHGDHTIGEYADQLRRIGGQFNASTNYLTTDYYATFPSRFWRAILELEAKRQQAPAITAKNVENQINTVLDEKLMRIDNMPYANALVKLAESLFANTPYAHPVIGYEQTLKSATAASVRAFYQRNYGPNRAILVIGGDIARNEVLHAVRELFGSWQPVPERDPKIPSPETLFHPGDHRITDERAPWPGYVVIHQLSHQEPTAYLQEKLMQLFTATASGFSRDPAITDSSYLAMQTVMYQKPLRLMILAVAPRAHISREAYLNRLHSWQTRLVHLLLTDPSWLCAAKMRRRVIIAELLDDIEQLVFTLSASWYRFDDPMHWWALNDAFMALTPKEAARLLKDAFTQPVIFIELQPGRWHLKWLKKLLEWLPQSVTEEVESWVL